MQDLSFQCSGFCGVHAPERVGSVACGTRDVSLRRVSSVVVVCGLSCPAACGILVPRPGIETVSLALEDGFFTTGPPGKSQIFFRFSSKCVFCFPVGTI